MGRFERKIQKLMREEVEDFDVWYERNKDKFPGLSDVPAAPQQEVEPSGAVKLKRRLAWAIPLAFVLVALCVFLCCLPLILDSGSPSRFGEERVQAFDLSVEERQAVLDEYPFMSELNVISGTRRIKTDDSSLVFISLNCELDMGDNYYFVTVQIEYNPYYDFVTKEDYENLNVSTEKNGFAIEYRDVGTDTDGLYWYYMASEKDGQHMYWEVHSVTQSIDQFIDIMFTE